MVLLIKISSLKKELIKNQPQTNFKSYIQPKTFVKIACLEKRLSKSQTHNKYALLPLKNSEFAYANLYFNE